MTMNKVIQQNIPKSFAKLVFFSELGLGELFNMLSGKNKSTFMKTGEITGGRSVVKAINLASGELHTVQDFASVVRVDSCTITME